MLEARAKASCCGACGYFDDKDLCVVTALDEYILRSSKWRKESKY